MLSERQPVQIQQASLEALHRRQRARHLPDMTISDAVDAIISHWTTVAAFAALFAVLGVVGTLLFPAGYKTTGFLVVDARRSSVPEMGIITVQPGDPRVPRSEAKVLTAPEFLAALVDRLGLDQVPFIVDDAKAADSDDPLLPKDPARRLSTLRRDAAIEWLTRKLDVRGEDRSYAIEVSITTPDPSLSAKIVNAAMALYLERRNRDDTALVESANKAVTERYNQILKEVRGLEAKLLEAHDAKGLVGTKAGRIDALDLTKINDEQRENEKQIAALSDSLAHARHADETNSWQEIDSSIASPYLLKLLEQETMVARARADAAATFGSNHPDLIKLNDELAAVHRRIHVEVARIALTLSTQIDALRQRQTVLAAEAAARTQAAAKVEAADEQIRQLEEELTGKQQLLAAYEMRRQQLASSVGANAGAVRVGAWATVPIKPAGPHPAILVVLAGFVGALIGIAFILVKRRFGDRMESSDEVIAIVGLPVFGAVPEIKRRKKSINPRLIWGRCFNNPRGVLAESVRNIYMRMEFALRSSPATVLLTSAHSGEGKTSIAFSIAQIAALNGKKVLLVDGDLFRAGVSRAARVMLKRGADLDALSIVTDCQTGLDILPAPLNLLPHEQDEALCRVGTILSEVRTRYDLVLIDTPPVMHASDATLLAPQSDAILFIASLRHVHRSTLIEALERVESAGRPILGIALSRAKISRRRDRSYYAGRYDRPWAAPANLRQASTRSNAESLTG